MKKNQQKVIKERKIGILQNFWPFPIFKYSIQNYAVFLWIRQNDADPTGVANPS